MIRQIIRHLGLSVYVEWDADGSTNVYRYGGGGYDLVPVDEPRIPKFGEDIAVGCQVRPGQLFEFPRVGLSSVNLCFFSNKIKLSQIYF